jgi:uncharacterized membrane protein YphA (DoxX/SURF4 family)
MKRRVTAREWVDANRDLLWDLLRVYLGFALVIKGIVYMLHQPVLASQMQGAGVPMASTTLAEIVALTHVAGGLMLAFGILTRVGAAIQIPNLLGAVFYVHIGEGLFTPGQTLEFATLVLFMLTLYAVGGAGRLSIDYYFSAQREGAPRPIESSPPAHAPDAEPHPAHG